MRYFVFTLISLTFLLILLGGTVHNTGSSLACPDWPLCYGQVMPEMKGQIAIEHSHRLLASAVGLLTIGLTVILWKKNGLRVWGLAALGLVIFQGLLGGVTVLFKLPPLVSIAHLGASMLFFSCLIVIALTLPSPACGRGGTTRRWWVRALLVTTLAFVYLQILLGAAVRHTGSGLVCPEIPFCHGMLWPTGSWMTQLHMSHRILGIIVTLMSAGCLFFFWNRSSRTVRTLLTTSLILVLIQIGLGILTIFTLIGPLAVTAHLAVATLLLGTSVASVATEG